MAGFLIYFIAKTEWKDKNDMKASRIVVGVNERDRTPALFKFLNFLNLFDVFMISRPNTKRPTAAYSLAYQPSPQHTS